MGELLAGHSVPLSLCEFNLWADFRQKYGLDTDRLEYVSANGASAMCHAWGAKVTPERILPKFDRPRKSRASKRKLVAQLSSLPGPELVFIPNDPTKPRLYGVEALAMLDPTEEPVIVDESRREPVARDRGRTLDGPRPQTRPQGEKRTLRGD